MLFRMRIRLLAPSLALVLASAASVRAQPIDPDDVPVALRAYVPWVVSADPTYGCTRAGEELVCAWPGTLELRVEGTEVRFALSAVLDRERVLPLPGGEGQWPVDVRADGAAAAVLAAPGGVPAVQLGAGTHRIEGRIRFGRRPESLRVPGEIARVFAIGQGGARVPIERASEGVVTLRSVATGGGDEGDEGVDSVSFEVVRHVEDGVPVQIVTQIVARVGGRPRALSLGRALVAGSVPSAVESSVPVQVSPEGDVVLQVESGTHRIRIAALVADPRARLVAPRLPAPWPEREIWVLAPSERHRQIDVRDVPSIDPQSPSIPEDWRASAAFALEGGQAFTIVETRRGEPEPPPNALSFDRQLWLDFDGHGFTVRDRITGEMHRAARLDLREGDLGRVTIAGQDQLVTMPPGAERSDDGPRGVEVRSANVDVTAELRLDAPPRDLPAVGWSEDARSLSMTVNLPPGHSLFAATGVDYAPAAWLSQWDVGPLFLVLLLTIVVGRLFGVAAGAVTLVTLTLAYHEVDAPRFAWLFVVVPAAILRLVARGRFARLVYVFYALSAVTLIIQAGFFVAEQLRYAMHPQLYTEDRFGSSTGMFLEHAEAPMMEDAAMSGGASERTRYGIMGSDVDEGPMGGMQRGAPGARSAPDNWIDPNAVVQTGYGVVDWSHSQVTLTWNGPVAKDHHIHLYVIRPWLQRVLALARALGIAFMIFVLFRARPSWPEPAAPKTSPPAAGQAAAAALVALIALVPAGRAAAQGDAPTPELLEQLAQRLTEPPLCGADCTQIGDARIDVEGDTLRMTLVAHAGARASLALPGPAASLVPDEVLVDGARSDALRAGADGHIELRLEPGVHTVVMAARIAGRASIALAFAERPGRVEVHAEGFTVSGVDENGLVRGSLELRRQLEAAATAEGDGAQRTADVPLWVTVERHLDVGVQWIVRTTIRRRSTTSAPAVVRLPALPGEVVLGTEATVERGAIVATLGQGVPELSFTSSVPARPQLSFALDDRAVAAADVHRSETWSYSCSPLWHCTDEGLAPIQAVVDGTFRPTFAPYPGDGLTLHATRLEAAPGASVTIDGATLVVRPGGRATDSELTLEVRTSVSNTLVLGLPSGARVERVEVDGQRRPAQLERGSLRVGVVPSSHRVLVAFTEPRGMGTALTTPRVTIGSSVVDVNLRVELPEDRWLLFATGPSWGPIVLFWGHLALVLFVAFALGRVARSPLETYEWALLALGLLQLPIPFTLVVAAWFFFVRFQHDRKLAGRSFNAAQVLLGLHAFVAAVILIGAAWVGLTDRPDMQVVGNGSYASSLSFYQDRAHDALPTAKVITVSMWLWKGLMLAWAFWLARSVVRWALWAVGPFRDGGFFVDVPPPPRPPASTTPPPTGAFGVAIPRPAPAAPAPAPAPPAAPPPGPGSGEEPPSGGD